MNRLFAYRLARDLGIPNVDRMLRDLSSRQLAEWMAFYHLEHQALEEERRRVKGV